MPYAEVVELALYHPEFGFYSSGGQAGRRGDFMTSPEVGPLFGHVVANALDAEWDRLGQPELFTVVDYGAGPGTLARAVLAAGARCANAMRYVAVEQSVEQRSLHPEFVLSLEELSPEIAGDGLVGVVIANELLDNLAFTRVQRIEGSLTMLDVAVAANGSLTTVPSAAVPTSDDLFSDVVSDVVFQPEAASWLEGARSAILRGSVIVIDYARLRSEDVEIRTYAEHQQAGEPLQALGDKDITVDVDLEQLQRVVAPADRISTQADWLVGHGIESLVEEGRRIWEASAGIGDLAALKARSRIREAEALMDPVGLGGFLVAEWLVAE